MRLLTLLAAGASLLGLAAAMPEAYPAAEDLNVVGRLGKRALIDNLERREREVSTTSFDLTIATDTSPPPVCNGTIVLDTSTQPYVIVEGDTLTKIAQNFTRGICDIARYNNITNPDYIKAGATITIPPQVCIADSTTCINVIKPTANCINGGPGFFIIQEGDTIGQLAEQFNITTEALIAANKDNIPNPDLVNVGDVANVPMCDHSSADLTPYRIKDGDTFYILAQRYRSSTGAIRAVNPGINPNKLEVGQVITLVSFARKFPGSEPTNEL